MTTALTIANSPKGVAFKPQREQQAGAICWFARSLVMLILGVIYAGCLQFFITISSALLYGTYVVIVACLALRLFFHWSEVRNLASVLPYVAWLCGYFLWGMVASSNSEVFKEGVKFLIKNILIIGALALVLDRNTLRPFVQLVMLGVIGNFAICLWETFDPSLVAKIAHTREQGATAYNVLRPAGLWSNPDEASSAFFFSLILSRWAPGMLAQVARCCAVVGILLTASRTGSYIVFICLLTFAAIYIRQRGIGSRLLSRICVLGVAILALGSAAVNQSWINISPDAQINRLLDFAEETRGVHEASRLEIAVDALQTASQKPLSGHGLFTFQHESGLPAVLELPAHNIYLTVWGEAGLLIAIAYGLILALGVWLTIQMPLQYGDQVTLLLMWFCYLLIGVTWHNQFTAFSGMLYIGLLWRLPVVLAERDDYLRNALP